MGLQRSEQASVKVKGPKVVVRSLGEKGRGAWGGGRRIPALGPVQSSCFGGRAGGLGGREVQG